MHSTQEFYVETQLGKNHGMLFLLYKDYIQLYRHQLDGSSNSLDFVVPTRRRLQPPSFNQHKLDGSTHSLVYKH